MNHDSPSETAKPKPEAKSTENGIRSRFRKQLIVIGIDILSLVFSFVFIGWWMPANLQHVFDKYGIPFLGFVAVWVITGLYFDKYNFRETRRGTMIILQIIFSNLLVLGIATTLLYFFKRVDYSRAVVIGTVLLSTAIEIFFSWMEQFLFRHHKGEFLYEAEPPVGTPPPPTRPVEVPASQPGKSIESIRHAILEEAGQAVYDFIALHYPGDDKPILTLSTTTRFNLLNQPDHHFHTIINLKRINDIQFINKFFEAVNSKLPQEGIFIGCAETYVLRKQRILKKYPPLLNWVMYSLDYVIKRIFPKLILTKKIYFFITRGQNRVISMAETLGRLYSCGFEVKEEKFINGLLWFIARKVKEPAYDYHPTYGPLIRLKRIGKNGRIIGVYKMRTMHAYSEYLQQYVYERNALQEGGKFADDFRITTVGKIMRKTWLDELPMLINLLRGDLKIVGVRPLSKHYFSLYSHELQELRKKHKPGLIPPFYADMPRTLDEIMASEKKYLEAYSRNPFLTDFVYFWRALYNILIKKARSN